VSALPAVGARMPPSRTVLLTTPEPPSMAPLLTLVEDDDAIEPSTCNSPLSTMVMPV
jgi:hypothetical protein